MKEEDRAGKRGSLTDKADFYQPTGAVSKVPRSPQSPATKRL